MRTLAGQKSSALLLQPSLHLLRVHAEIINTSVALWWGHDALPVALFSSPSSFHPRFHAVGLDVLEQSRQLGLAVKSAAGQENETFVFGLQRSTPFTVLSECTHQLYEVPGLIFTVIDVPVKPSFTYSRVPP